LNFYYKGVSIEVKELFEGGENSICFSIFDNNA
jgi:hypothetical protein